MAAWQSHLLDHSGPLGAAEPERAKLHMGPPPCHRCIQTSWVCGTEWLVSLGWIIYPHHCLPAGFGFCVNAAELAVVQSFAIPSVLRGLTQPSLAVFGPSFSAAALCHTALDQAHNEVLRHSTLGWAGAGHLCPRTGSALLPSRHSNYHGQLSLFHLAAPVHHLPQREEPRDFGLDFGRLQ